MAIRIFADSVSDIPKELSEELGITIVPLQVNFADGSYRDGIDLSVEDFFAKLKTAEKMPTTSQVNPGEFIQAFGPVIKEGDDVICLTLSSKLSGTYSAATTAKNFLDAGDQLTVVDTRAASFGFGLIVMEVAKMVGQGASKEEIIAEINYMADHLENIFVFDTLEYLKKGGRLSSGEAFIGGLLNIKPILTIIDGEVKPMDKVRGRKKAVKYVVDKLKASGQDFTKTPLVIYHADDGDYMNEIKAAIEADIPVSQWYVSKVGSVVGTHSGPGCVAISYIQR